MYYSAYYKHVIKFLDLTVTTYNPHNFKIVIKYNLIKYQVIESIVALYIDRLFFFHLMNTYLFAPSNLIGVMILSMRVLRKISAARISCKSLLLI